MLRCIFFIPLIIGIITVFSFSLNAQNLYMPSDVKGAYKKETRSMDGKPGKNYWQNYGRYNISTPQITYGKKRPFERRTKHFYN